MQGLFETAEDELNRMDGITPEPPQKVEPFVPTCLPDTPPLPAPGIYFGMPEDAYHALPALSSHGVKEILASPMLFWARRNWLSEQCRKDEAEAAAEPKDRIYRTIGKAYHCRILEGEEEYAKRFACELSAEDCEGALESTDQLKAAITAHGQKPWSKVWDVMPDTKAAYERPARKEDWAKQLLTIDPNARILSQLRHEYALANAGKAFIPADAHAQIAIAARMIEADPEIRHAFSGGYPEVTLIWHCGETGVPMKARVDYLKLKAAVDLKSIKFEGGMSIERALARAIASYHYNFQPAVYVEGIAEVRRLVRAHFLDAINVNAPDETDISSECAFAERWSRDKDDPKWLFVFQAKGPAPITRACFYPLGGTTHMITRDMVKTAKRRFRQFSETFGTEPWLDVQPVYDLADEDLPAWATDI